MKIQALAFVAMSTLLGACASPQMDYADAPPDLPYAPAIAYDEPAPVPYAPPPIHDLDGAPRYEPQHFAPRRASCDIRVHNTRNGVAITPVAMLDRSISGEYDLVLTKSGASGSSDVSQGGRFDARAGETVKLGETELSMGRRDHYRVVLTLTDRGREICRTEVRS